MFYSACFSKLFAYRSKEAEAMTNTVALFADVMGFAAAIEQFSTLDQGRFGLNQFNFSSAHPPFLPDNPAPSQLAEHKLWNL